MNLTRSELIEALLKKELSPTHLEIIDDSPQHAGHKGASHGGGYFTVVIASPHFAGKSRITAHQLVYRALDPMIDSEIHALSIKIVTT